MRRAITITVSLFAAMVAGVAQAEPDEPTPRIYHSMFPQEDGRFLVLGGISEFGFEAPILSGMWTYEPDNLTWSSAGEFEAGYLIGAAYDKQSNRIIALALDGDTWAFDPSGKVWRQMDPETAPSGRCGHSLSYDEQSDRIVLFGGFACTDVNDPLLNDTWTYDFEADAWREHHSDTIPPARMYASMVYHAGMDRIVMWGGRVEDDRILVFRRRERRMERSLAGSAP